MRVFVIKFDGIQVEVYLDQGFCFLGMEIVDND